MLFIRQESKCFICPCASYGAVTAQKPGLTLFPYRPCYCPDPRDSSLHICAVSTGGAEPLQPGA